MEAEQAVGQDDGGGSRRVKQGAGARVAGGPSAVWVRRGSAKRLGGNLRGGRVIAEFDHLDPLERYDHPGVQGVAFWERVTALDQPAFEFVSEGGGSGEAMGGIFLGGGLDDLLEASGEAEEPDGQLVEAGYGTGRRARRRY